VPPQVRDHILKVCAQNLSAHGIAYVSYNVHPGWHIGALMRDMVNYHGRRYADPRERIQQVQGFLDFVTALVERDADNTLYHQILSEEVRSLRESGDSYLFHEFLEDVNQPVYFHEFAARAAGAGLQFVSEALLSLMVANLPNDVKDKLHGWANDIIEYEQYLDFVRNRRFRMSLLCHASRTVNRTPGPEMMPHFRYTAFALPTGEPSPEASGTEQFKTATGITLSTNHPWLRGTMRALASVYPRSVSYAELAERVRGHLAAGIEWSEASFQQGLHRCALSALVVIHLHDPEFVSEAGERPIASPLARFQARQGRWPTNRRHRNVELSVLEHTLLPALDGTSDRAALVEMLAAKVAGGVPLQDETGQTVSEPARVREVLEHAVENALRRLAWSALLVG
jgi:methyltransferase-like protein